MNVDSIIVSQTEFCDVVSNIRITSEPTSGFDTPIPRARISDDTILTLNTVSSRLEDIASNTGNPRKRRRDRSPKSKAPKEIHVETQGHYPKESKSVYLNLKNLYRKKLSMASSIKTMKERLSKNQYATSVDFRFNVNNTRNPVLRDSWTKAICKCKTDMTLIDNLQKAYNKTKAEIAKEMTILEWMLKPEQVQEIRESLNNRFKQMVLLFMERKANQYREDRGQPRKKNSVPKRSGQQKGNQNNPKLNTLINTLKVMLKK